MRPNILCIFIPLLALASAEVFFEERFEDGWEKGWVKSDWKKDDNTAGEWNYTSDGWEKGWVKSDWKKDDNTAGEWNYTSGKWHGDAVVFKWQDRKLVSKLASFQQYIQHDFDASDHGTSSFPVAAVHRIGIRNLFIWNS